jgi:hypothetical protein
MYLCVEVLFTGCFGLCVLGVEFLYTVCVLRFCVIWFRVLASKGGWSYEIIGWICLVCI